MRIAVCILAKNEAQTIGVLLGQLGRQRLFSAPDLQIDVHVVANGCSDGTADRAVEAKALLHGTNAVLTVHDLPEGGKSRSWNRAVHQLIAPGADFFLFLDSDITFAREDVLVDVVAALHAHPDALACSGHPVKDIARKERKTALERFSLAISRQSFADGAINGSLYLVRASALRSIWLPDQTPAEDGFLNAMLETDGFSSPVVRGKVISMKEVTHYYRAHRPADFILHERRIIVGTIINRWIFEHLWSLRLDQPAGPLIRQWNEQKPDWVDRLIAERTKGEAWVIPNAILFGRLSLSDPKESWKWPLKLARGSIATLMSLPPVLAANRRLKQLGAAETW